MFEGEKYIATLRSESHEFALNRKASPALQARRFRSKNRHLDTVAECPALRTEYFKKMASWLVCRCAGCQRNEAVGDIFGGLRMGLR